MDGIKAGIYLRLSREDDSDNEESNSISNQRLITIDYAKYHEYEVLDEYVDDGYSGTNFNRPGWKRLLEDCKNGRINCVIIKDLSRMGRNNIECGNYLENVFPVWGVRLIAISDAVDSSKLDDPGVSLSVNIKNLVNDIYCRDISTKIKTSFAVKMRRGDFIGGSAPYGYQIDPENKNHLLIDEDEVEVVRTIFRLKIEGMNSRNIAAYLDESGIPSPAVRRGLLELGAWKEQSVVHILRNETYLGRLAQGKTKKVSYRSKRVVQVPKEEWIRVEGTHDPIIGYHTFEYVQELLGMDTTTGVGKTHLFLLSGFLRCGDCGQNLIHYRSAGHGYYHCSEHQRDKTACRSAHCCSEIKIIRAVTNAIRRQIQILKSVRNLMEEQGVMPKRKAQLAKVDDQIREQVELISRTREKQTFLFKHMIEELLSKEEYNLRERRYQDTIEAAEKTIGQLQEKRQKLVDEIAYFLPWIKTVCAFGEVDTLNRTILISLVHHIDVYEGGKIRIAFRYADDIEEIIHMADLDKKPAVKTVVRKPKPAKVTTILFTPLEVTS